MVPWDRCNLLINLVATDLSDFDFDLATSATVEFYIRARKYEKVFLNVCVYYTHLYNLCGGIGELYILLRFMRILFDRCMRQWIGKKMWDGESGLS